MKHEWETFYMQGKIIMLQKCIHCGLNREIYTMYSAPSCASHSSMLYYLEDEDFPLNDIDSEYLGAVTAPLNCAEVKFRCLML